MKVPEVGISFVRNNGGVNNQTKKSVSVSNPYLQKQKPLYDSVSFSSKPKTETDKKSQALKMAVSFCAVTGTIVSVAAILKGRVKAGKFEKNVAKAIEEAYGEYSQFFSHHGVKNLPKPHIHIDKTSAKKGLASYTHGLNVIKVNESILGDFIKNNCYFVDKDGKVLIVKIQGKGKQVTHLATIFKKDDPNLKEIAKKFNAEVRYFDERIQEPFMDGVLRHEMRHWAQGIVCANNPGTATRYKSQLRTIMPDNIEKLRAQGLQDMYEYKPSNIDIRFTRKTKQGDVVYKAEDFMKNIKSGLDEYSLLPAEIDADWEAFKYLEKKYGNVTDKELKLQLDALKGFFVGHDPYFWSTPKYNPVNPFIQY